MSANHHDRSWAGRVAGLGVAITVAVVLSGCGSGSGTSAATQSAPSRAAAQASPVASAGVFKAQLPPGFGTGTYSYTLKKQKAAPDGLVVFPGTYKLRINPDGRAIVDLTGGGSTKSIAFVPGDPGRVVVYDDQGITEIGDFAYTATPTRLVLSDPQDVNDWETARMLPMAAWKRST